MNPNAIEPTMAEALVEGFWLVVEQLSDELHLLAVLVGVVLGAVFMASVLPESWA